MSAVMPSWRQRFRKRLDVALLDMHMPGRNGLDVLRALAAREDAPAVIVLTGHGDIAMAVEAMKLKAADFLQKPYPPVALLETLEMHARRA
jgi:two-component system response regulator FixJ